MCVFVRKSVDELHTGTCWSLPRDINPVDVSTSRSAGATLLWANCLDNFFSLHIFYFGAMIQSVLHSVSSRGCTQLDASLSYNLFALTFPRQANLLSFVCGIRDCFPGFLWARGAMSLRRKAESVSVSFQFITALLTPKSFSPRLDSYPKHPE